MKQVGIKKVLATAKNNYHSLLFSSKQEQDNWFALINKKSAYKPMLNEIRREAEGLLKEPNKEISYSVFKLFSENGSRLEYEKIYFAKRRRLTTFAIAALLEPDNPAYREALQEIIWSICNEYSWCLPAHLKNSPEMSVDDNYSLQDQTAQYSIDLFASETAFALSEVLQLSEDFLDPLICKRIRQEVYRRVIWPFTHQQRFGWETATHNWAAVCAGSIGSVALHLFEDDDELSVVLERVLDTMESYLEGFNDDGTCMEGYGYWQYGFGFYVYFSDLLKKKTAGKLNLFKSKKVHKIALFQQKSFLDKNRVVNFSDAQPTASVFLGLSHYLGGVYSDFELPEYELRAHFTDDHCSRWAPALRNLLWFDEKVVGKPWGETTYYLTESQWFISRHLAESGRYAFAAKGGHNDEPHNHNDVGQFILHGNGETFLKDLGSGLYNDAYFSKQRYSFLCNGSHGHSVPIINNQYQHEGATKSASIRNVSTGDKVESFEVNFTNAYTIESLQQLTRKFTWEKTDKPSLALEDTYTFSDHPDSIVERLITPALSINKNAEGVILGGKQKLRIKFDCDQVDLQVNKIEFLNHTGVEEKNLALDFIVKKPEKESSFKIVFQFE